MGVNPLDRCYSNRLVNERGRGGGRGVAAPESFDMQIK